MVFRNRVAKMKLVEQLTLVTLQTAHHGSTSSRFASTLRNHASWPLSTDFCNKIGTKRKWRDVRLSSAVDAVDGSSTGTSVPWMWALLRLPRFRGASDADDNDNRFRHRKVGFPGSRRRRWRPGDCSQAIEASLCTDLLPEAIALSGRYRSLRVCSPL